MSHLTQIGRRFVKAGGALASLAIAQAAWSATINVAGGDAAAFQNALDSAQPGDEIVLQANTTYVAPSNENTEPFIGGFELQAKGSSTQYITIRTSNVSSLPLAGTRLDPVADTSLKNHLARIQVGNGSLTGRRALRTALPPAVAHHYKFIGLEFVGPADNTAVTSLLSLGEPTDVQNSVTLVPHHFVVDRCYFHPNTPSARITRAIALNSGDTDIVDSYFEEIHTVGSADSQAIGGTNGTGNYNIINNHLEAASENIMFGGAYPHIGQIAENIVVRRNHMIKPTSWRDDSDGGTNPNGWTQVKNIFEIKAGRNILVEENILDNCWTAAQTGFGLSIKVDIGKPQNSWVSPDWDFYKTENVTFQNNLIRNVGIGMTLQGRDWFAGGGSVSNLTIANNLWIDIGGDRGSGDFIKASHGCKNVTLDHNTALHDGNVINASSITYKFSDFVFTNNVVDHNTYGIKGESTTLGNPTMDAWFQENNVPDGIFLKNVMVNSNNVSSLTSKYSSYPMAWSPTSLAFPALLSDVLANPSSPGSDYAGYKIKTGTSYVNAAVDESGTPTNKDIGCDIDQVMALTAGCISGDWGSSGGLVAADDFNYTVSGGLNGNNGGSGYGAAWAAVSGQTNPALASGSLTYGSLQVSGNKLAPAVNSRSTRNFSSAIVTGTNTYWVSFIAKYTGGGTVPSNHAGFSLFTGTAGSGTEIFLGKPGSATNWGVWHSGGQGNNVSGTIAADAFVVVKLTFNGTQLNAQMWVNKPLSESSLGTPDAQITASHSANLASMRISTGGNASNFQFDEFRIGSSFASVAPTNATPTTVTLKNGVNGYSGAQSFNAKGSGPTTHYGPATYHQDSNRHSPTSQYVLRAFYKFDVSSIPNGSTIDSATLRIKVENTPGTGVNLEAYRVMPVNAFTVNYSAATRNSPLGNSTQWSGGLNAGGSAADSNNDFLDTPDDSATVSGPAWYELDVTSSVQAWVNGTANNGWILTPNPSGGNVVIYMGSTADNNGSGDYPELEITHH